MASKEHFVLSPATPGDIPILIECYLSAFTSDVLTTFTFPREVIGQAEMRLWMAKFLANHFTHPEVHFYKITETNSGKLAAWMRCAFPHSLTPEEKEKREMEKNLKLKEGTFWPKGANLEAIAAKFGGLEGKKKMYYDKRNMFYVQLMATSPEFQKRGLASRLLHIIMDLADRERKTAYIEASDAGFPVYQKLGWRHIDTVKVDLTKWGGVGFGYNRVMVREPQPLS